MGKLKIQPITNDQSVLIETICEMMGIDNVTKAFSMNTLIEAIKRLPVSTNIHFDKVYGRWIFSNQYRDFWPSDDRTSYCDTSGANFTFVERTPEIAIIKGIHYFYHSEAF